jgi:uncharacterized protein YbbC (DUF1343 family)
MYKKFLFLLLIFFTISCAQEEHTNKLLFGADRLIPEFSDLIEGKRLGIVTNHTAVLSNGIHVVDTLFNNNRFEVTALFGPEHGIRGDAPAGKKITDASDSKTGLPAYSLYGENRKPTKEMLKNVDVLIFDIQDIGARFYTYISTLFYIVQCGAENNIPVIVLDRPNPINGVSVEGPIRKDDQHSFVGIAPLSIRHGMTVGELAKFFAGEKLIGKNLTADLTVIEVEGWDRNKFYDFYGKEWISPSPNIPNLNTAIVYPGTCFIEGTNLSEGRGTYEPFLTIGAPFVNSKELIEALNSLGHEGIELEEAKFLPISISNMSTSPKHESEECYGFKINVINADNFDAVDFGIKLLTTLKKLYPDDLKFRDAFLDKLLGDSAIRQQINDNSEPEKIIGSWQTELNDFKKIREKYLLY